MKLWNAHTENFETKVMSGSGEDLSFMSSLDNSILSLKGNITVYRFSITTAKVLNFSKNDPPGL